MSSVEPLAPITVNIRLIALVITVVLSLVVLGPIIYLQRTSDDEETS